VIRVSASAFDILWADLGFTRPPPPLRVPSVGATGEERAAIREAVYRNLAERGLYTGGRVDPALAVRLETLATADLYVECEALPDLAGDVGVRAVAAAAGKQAVLAVQPGRTIGLTAIRDTGIWAAIVDLLPPAEPGPGQGASLPASILGSPIADPVFDPATGGSPAHARQLREVLAIQARPVLGAGQFSVRVREGARVRRAGGVSWFVTDAGAYLGAIARGRGGQDWASVAPADPRRLAARLADLVDQAVE
jgi:hypothetical protein